VRTVALRRIGAAIAWHAEIGAGLQCALGSAPDLELPASR
jgi:hypothetical protein